MQARVDELLAVDVEAVLPRVLAHRDVASREPLYRHYDAVVRGCTVLPRGAADAGVLAPLPGSRLGVALAIAGNPRLGKIDARYAAEHAVLEAMRRVVAVGGAADRSNGLLELRQSAQTRPIWRIRCRCGRTHPRRDGTRPSVRLRQRQSVQRIRRRQGRSPRRRS